MKLAMTMALTADVHESARLVADLEAAGLDMLFVPESYSLDAISSIGYLAAMTTRMQIGTGIVSIFTRTPTLLGMTAAGCDFVTNGRFMLGIGASGPQVIEGFHGLAFEQPLARTLDCLEIVRKVLRREALTHDAGGPVTVPLDGAKNSPYRPLKLIERPRRPSVPIWWASLMSRSVEATAELADGWMPYFYVPELAERVWGSALARGAAKRSQELAALEIMAGGPVLVTDRAPVEVEASLRAKCALYVGGMGPRGANFYNTICSQYGWEAEASRVQDLYLDGHKDGAAAAVPQGLVDGLHLCGPEGHVRERIAAFAESGVSVLSVEPVPGADIVRTVELLRRIVDS